MNNNIDINYNEAVNGVITFIGTESDYDKTIYRVFILGNMCSTTSITESDYDCYLGNKPVSLNEFNFAYMVST
jgi:hypothetical protein